MKEQGLLLPFQLQDHRVGLPRFFLLSLQGYGQRLVVLLDALQDGVGGVSPWEKTWPGCYLLNFMSASNAHQAICPCHALAITSTSLKSTLSILFDLRNDNWC